MRASLIHGLAFAPFLAATSALAALPAFPVKQTVKCGDKTCGTMEISLYEKFADGDAAPTYERNGVSIAGKFTPAEGVKLDTHYLQALTAFNDPDIRWSKDTTVPLPGKFLDAPPFGQEVLEVNDKGAFVKQVKPQDALPWYDEPGEFPDFEDQPKEFLDVARRNGAVSMHFESWLVCVISATPGKAADRVSDDKYVVAPLAGWTWGFDVAYKDVGVIGKDELADYTFTMLPFAFVAAPTADFKTALGAIYGKKGADNFDITLGTCDKCVAPVPEPGTGAMVLAGLLGLAGFAGVRRRWPGAHQN